MSIIIKGVLGMNCRNCGIKIPDRYLKSDSFRCPKCGRRYQRMPNPNGQKTVSSAVSSRTMSSSRRQYKKKKALKLCILIVILLFIIFVSVASIIDANHARREQNKHQAEELMSFGESNSLPVNTTTKPVNTVITTASTIMPIVEAFEANNNQEELGALKNGLEEYNAEESTFDTFFKSELDSSAHSDVVDSFFSVFYSESFGTDETHYVFNGTVNTGDVTEQELGYPQLHSYSVIYDDGWSIHYQ